MSSPNQSSENFDQQVSKRIREIRVQRGMTLQHVAEKLDMVFQQLHKYEAGLVRVSAGMLISLAEIFECEVADLIPPLLRGVKPLDVDARLDILKKEIVNLVLASNSESTLIALKTLLERSISHEPEVVAQNAK